jgi:hypothetical protein
MIAYVPLVYCFLPETAGRTLEQMDYLFASNSALTWNEEKEFEKRMAIFNENLGRTKLRTDENSSSENAYAIEKPSVAMIDQV